MTEVVREVTKENVGPSRMCRAGLVEMWRNAICVGEEGHSAGYVVETALATSEGRPWGEVGQDVGLMLSSPCLLSTFSTSYTEAAHMHAPT